MLDVGTRRRLAERKLQRAARALGLKVHRSALRLGSVHNFGDWQIVHAKGGAVLAGPCFDLSVNRAAAWLAGYAHKRNEFDLAAELRVLAADRLPPSTAWLWGYPGS